MKVFFFHCRHLDETWNQVVELTLIPEIGNLKPLVVVKCFHQKTILTFLIVMVTVITLYLFHKAVLGLAYL